MDSTSLILVARRLMEAGPAEYLPAAGVELQRLIPSEDALWMRTDFFAGTSFVWRASTQTNDRAVESVARELYCLPAVQTYVRKPFDLTPRRDSDVPAPGTAAANAALQLSQQLVGPTQLSLMLNVSPPASGHGWVITRDSGTFSDSEAETASQVLPLLMVLDHYHRPTTVAAMVERDVRWSQLTTRERQVVELLTTGLTARAIARLLGISPRTVDKHLENSYRKLGRHDRLTVAVNWTSR